MKVIFINKTNCVFNGLTLLIELPFSGLKNKSYSHIRKIWSTSLGVTPLGEGAHMWVIKKRRFVVKEVDNDEYLPNKSSCGADQEVVLEHI